MKFILNYLEKKVTQVNNSNFLYKYFAEWDLTLYRILAFTGICGGEALLLLWDDINYYKKTLSISKTLSQTRTGYAVLPPKTKKSCRTSSLDSKTIKILKKWQLHLKEYLFQNGIVNNSIIFSNFEGKYSNRQALYRRSARIAEFTHMPNVGTHGWRHTHASMLYEAGIPMKEAQERLGHTSLEITNSIYTHLSEKQKNGTAEKLASFADF